MPNKLLNYRFNTLATISLIWVIFGIVFYENLINRSNDLGVYISRIDFALIFGVVGCVISATLVFYLKRTFNDLKDWIALIIKLFISLLLFIVITFLLLFIYYTSQYEGGLAAYWHSFITNIVHTHTFFIFSVDMGLMTIVSIIFLEVTDKYGPGMFWSMLVGEYHQPKIENRIFIFLDINDATSIAEDLGHERYFRMLRHFYTDITIPLMANDGAIYQYVGDEIVLTWPNTPENKIKSLKFLRHTYFYLERHKSVYERKFGKVPRFKAGVQAGEVTAGFIGVLKRELIYSGDTLNTAARIRSMCHELNASYLLSEDFMIDFQQPHGYRIEAIGEMDLKGRTQPIQLFTLQFE